MKNAFLAILLLLTTAHVCNSQEIHVERITTENGLSANNAYHSNAILLDSRGYTWIATLNGLNRWDGYEMTVYKHDPFDQNSISSNTTYTVEEDHLGRIWIGTDDSGVDIYDYDLDQFIHTDVMKNSKRIPRVNRIFKAKNDDMWIGTAWDGLYQLDISDSTLVHRPIFQDSVKNHDERFIVDIRETAKGEILVSNQEGMHLFSEEQNTFTHIEKHPCRESYLAIDDLGKIWFGCYWEPMIGIYDLRDSTMINAPFDVHAYVKRIFIDSKQNMWLSCKTSTDVFLVKYNLTTEKKVTYYHDPTNPNSIPNDPFRTMSEDKNGRIWFMTNSEGAGYFDPNRTEFEKIYQEIPYSIFLSNDSSLFVSTANKLHNLNLDDLSYYEIDAFKKHLDIYKDTYVSPMIKSSSGEYWFSTNSQRYLFSYDGTTTKPLWNAPGHMSSLVFDNEGKLWINYKLIAFDGNKSIETNDLLKQTGSKDLIIKEEFKDCRLLHDGCLITGGVANGLFIYNPSDTTLIHYKGNDVVVGKLSSSTISKIYESPSTHKVYVSTKTNLNILDRESSTFTYINPSDGLEGEVLSMIEDKSENLWILTSKGLYKVVDDKVVSKYGQASGISLDKSRLLVYNMIMDSENRIIFNTKDGIYRFDPDALEAPFVPLPIRIEHLYINRKIVSPDERNQLTNSSSSTAQLSLPFSKRDVGFGFVSINGKEHEVEYYYRLHGYSEEWIHLGDKREVFFTNLDNGDYTFEVKAKSAEGAWTENISTQEFTIQPPWYKRWWSYLLFSFLVFAILYGIYAYRVHQITRYQRLRTKISSDLHDDVGTLLSSLAMQSDVLGLDAPPEKASRYEKFSALSREAMDRMRDTVWAIDSRKDNLVSLIDRMADYISDMYENHRIQVNFKHDKSKLTNSLAPDIRQNVYLIFKEALNNAMKYSNGDIVNVSLIQSGKSITLSIHDNGSLKAIKTSGTGISNMKLRAKRIGGQLVIGTTDGFLVKVVVSL